MPQSVPVAAILQRVPQRARDTYHALLAHSGTRYDRVTGWAYAYIPQEELAGFMGCGLRTVTRAVADLRGVGIARVLSWPGATTETSLRVDDIPVELSVFGPLRLMQLTNDSVTVDQAVAKLIQEYDEILWDIELAFAQYPDGTS